MCCQVGAALGQPECPEGWEWPSLAPGRPTQATALRTQICLCLEPKKTEPPLFRRDAHYFRAVKL